MKFLGTKIKQGFTLIEIVTVLFIISLGLVGVLTLIVQNIQSQSMNKNNLIAYQLAQEGIELVRRTRDTNWKQGKAWDTGLAAGTYYMDYRDTTPRIRYFSYQAQLKQDANGFYYHDSSSEEISFFSRTITITKQVSWFGRYGHYIRVTVSWIDQGRTNSYELETALYGWK